MMIVNDSESKLTAEENISRCLLTYQDRTSRSTRLSLSLTQKHISSNAHSLLAINERIKLLTLPTLVATALATIASTSPKASLRATQPVRTVGPLDTLVDGGAFAATLAVQAAGVITRRDVVAAAAAHPEGGAVGVGFEGDLADVVELGLVVVVVGCDGYGEGRGGQGDDVCEEHCCGGFFCGVVGFFWYSGGI